MIPTVKLVLLLNTILAFQPVSTLPIHRPREVPQEHSHEKYLTSVRASLALNNPDGIVDPVFGLLGNAAAAAGLGKITDPDCLHQATADQAFTNAKAAGDIQSQVDALIFAALERNTGKVGLASVLCTSIKATNPEIAAISQHQDPASDNAAATNKAITLELAKQIAALGSDPLQALDAGTFAPGDVNDATGKGNTCDDANDPVGCIFTQNLLVDDATEDEIKTAVAGISAGSTVAASNATADASSSTTAASHASTSCVSAVTVTVTVTSASDVATTTAAAAATTSSGSLDFGDCTNPQIEFGVGFDGRREDSFEPVNKTEFNHGSAQDIGTVAQFICDRLNDQCKAPISTVDTCRNATTEATAVGKIGLAADTFNGLLGFTTDFANNPIGGAAALAAAAASTTTSAAADTTTAAAATASTTAASTTTAAAAASTTAASTAAVAGNLQTFTQALGGITAPPVTQSGSSAQPFCVQGNACFSSEQNALVRSCDVQHNQCANASNAAGQAKIFSVEDCGTQQDVCNQLATSP